MKGHRNTMSIQKEFQSIVEAAFSLCIQKFDDRLDAIYLGGSVATGEAWPGESDVDWFVFLPEEPSAGDKAWCKDNETALAARYPVAKEFHLNVFSTEFLRTENNMMKFIFKYNCLCLFGEKHLEMLENTGVTIPKPSRELVKGRIGWLKRCVIGLEDQYLPDELFGGDVPADFSKLLSTDFFVSRKLMRHFILLEGSHLLMLTGDFKSFRQMDVLPKISALYPQWHELIDMAATVLKNPLAAKISPAAARKKILPFAKWLIELVEKI
jgi:hypothetical protein